MKLWLDDLRKAPSNEWIEFTSPWKALLFLLLMGEEYDEWSLDHDLGDWPTGYEFLQMIELLLHNGCRIHVPETIGIHSLNPVGKAKMLEILPRLYQFSK